MTVPRAATDRDRGSITAMVVTMTVALIACAGLTFDGGRLLGARLDAADHAENAARAGAQHVTAIRDGHWRLDGPKARAGALDYLASVGVPGDAVVVGDDVTVTVSVHRRMVLLGLGGVGDRTVTATRTARPVDR